MTKVIDTLKTHGIQDADIQTAEVSLSPTYNTAGDTVNGYTATNAVTALIRHLDQSGRIIDAAVNAGANQVNGPNLSPADQQTLYQQALQAAVADAHTRAATIAAAANTTLGAVRTVTETTNTPIPLAASSAKTPAPTTPIQPGTIQTEADITVTYDIT